MKGFCERGYIWVYDRQLDSFRRQTPTTTTVMNHYYTVKWQDGTKSDEIERFWAWLESMAAPVLAKLERRKRPSDLEYTWFSTFLALLMVKVPAFRQKCETHILNAAATIATQSFGPNFFDKFKLEANEQYLVGMEVRFVSDFAKDMFEMDWTFQRSAKRYSFITCDNLLTLSTPPDQSTTGAGLLTPGVLKLIPLSSSICLVLGNRGLGISYKRLTAQFTKFINESVVYNCTRFVIARDRALLESLVSKAKATNWVSPFAGTAA